MSVREKKIVSQRLVRDEIILLAGAVCVVCLSVLIFFIIIFIPSPPLGSNPQGISYMPFIQDSEGLMLTEISQETEKNICI